ncbi:MAG: helicase-related protein, partial [Oligoflexia bacterium]
MRAPLQKLPIDQHLHALLEAIESNPCLLLEASPGTGKTTRLPPALLSRFSGQIWVLEPRRLAAKWAAHRVASELGEEVGQTVGYQFRFEKRQGPRTRLMFLTEGTLLRKLGPSSGDPLIRQCSVVVLDEFHERHLTTDLALTCLLELQKKRPDLKIVVMSATLDIQGLVPLIEKTCGRTPAVIEVDAPRHPVEIRHLARDAQGTPLDQLVENHARTLLSETSGDLLVFLPGMREILKVQASLQKVPARTLLLHGDLSREEQDAVMQPHLEPKLRRIILSTNLAESSVTLPNITSVIDSGLHRIASHSAWSGIPALRTRPISKASAIQRAGRAGRTAPGICQRLYGKADFEGRPSFEIPEIRRADLAQVILELRSLGVEGRLDALPWLDFPELSQWSAGARLLWLLGYLQSEKLDAGLTELGRMASGLSMH